MARHNHPRSYGQIYMWASLALAFSYVGILGWTFGYAAGARAAFASPTPTPDMFDDSPLGMSLFLVGVPLMCFLALLLFIHRLRDDR